MKIESIVAELDAEIARLTQVRKLLAGYGSATATAKVTAKAPAKARKKHTLSAEARKRIAEAQKRRWAAQKSKKKE